MGRNFGADLEKSAAIFRSLDPKFTSWKEGQQAAFELWVREALTRMLLMFPTGEGKSKTALALIHAEGYDEVIVIAPPRTHKSWQQDASALGMKLTVHSVQKFRMAGTKYPKGIPWIVDEFHLLGGHDGVGWKKMSRMTARMGDTPFLILSATPEYNDAERCFCVQAVMDGGNANYLKWLIDHCILHPNPHGYYPLVDEDKPFLAYDGSLDFLTKQRWCAYIEDTAEWEEHEFPLPLFQDETMETYGYDRRLHRMVNSDMQEYHRRVDYQHLSDDRLIRPRILNPILDLIDDGNKWFVYASHSTVARALLNTLNTYKYQAGIIDGETSEANVALIKHMFVHGGMNILIGTSSVATGVDGLDKVCQRMLILDDIRGDHALRRQLIGRILPRGVDDGLQRHVYRATFQ